MKFFIRADASEQLGIGHVMRCLALSEELIKHDYEVIFICKEANPLITRLIREKGCDLLLIDTPIFIDGEHESEHVVQLIINGYHVEQEDWLIVDHYSLDITFEQNLRKVFANIMVVDDLADRSHDCDILLDTSSNVSKRDTYDRLIPSSAIQLLGPEYTLLRGEFIEKRETLNPQDERGINNIFVCFGGTDPTNETIKTIKALQPIMNENIQVNIVLGKPNLRIEQWMTRNKSEYMELFIQPDSIAAIMSSSDLAICAGGGMTWERYCLGLPGLVIAVAENQLELAQQGQLLGIDKYIGQSESVQEQDITQIFMQTINHGEWLKEARNKAMALIDGKGASRVVKLLTEHTRRIELRDVGEGDVFFLWECRNETEARMNSAQIEEVTLNDHLRWLEQSKLNSERKLMVAWNKSEKIAVVRLDKENLHAIVSINVAQEHRGKGFAQEILTELERTASHWDRSIRILQAVIKKQNHASIKTFIKAEYDEWDMDEDFIIMRKKIEGLE
ncbi:GCN5-like N-acetyltransferase [Paenibacillus sp. FSL R5-192]|uniref:UDP-2,4-diacetamido-2,4, 6-trideoxy-beta-L-altropyranose hydrolase n=1 Tax=Paenibacillus sp. FSL R5-192 TaxID=1226754 RepID=UPI0003E1F003|nr:UDP-2,4-diacetamido-2,4,6-trideoxy-beta-L-altropyranose hydrolase [Paenibacillus sp. FSL R5-192]ETT41088.1 GCN5-like N-acetyltransferase [Paenibacillus sp. FSL R5-192]